MKPNKMFLAVNFLLLVLVAAIIISTTANPTPLHPKNNQQITDTTPEFNWRGTAHTLLIDDSEEFISSIQKEIQKKSYTLEQKLDFGTYYWKLVGKRNSSISSFEVTSVVAIKADGNELQNIGNTKINVTEFSRNKITGNIVLDESGIFDLDQSKNYEASQYEE